MFFIYFPFILMLILILYYFFSKKQEQLYRYYFLYYNNNVDERFEEIYSELTNENIEDLERIKNTVKIRSLLKHTVFIILVGAIILSLSYIIEDNRERTTAITSILICSMLIYIAINFKKDNNIEFYKRIYKNTIVAKFIKLYNPELIYKKDIEEKENRDIKSEYSEMEFSVESFDILEIKNCIYGELDNTTIMNMYDISLKLSGGSINPVTVFKGTYVTLNIRQNIPTNVKISKNKIINKEKNNVELDSSKFEEYFDVYSEDKVLAVRILTSDVMQMLIDFYERYYINFEIAIQDNKIHINLNTGEIFKVPIWGKTISKDEIYLQYAILEFVNKLSNEINEAINKIEF